MIHEMIIENLIRRVPGTIYKWMVIIGENTVMESAYIIDKQPYRVYLSKKEDIHILEQLRRL